MCRCACTHYIKDWEPIGARAKDQESMTRNQGPKVKDQDSRTMEPRTRSQGPRVKDEGPRVKDEESRTNIYIYVHPKAKHKEPHQDAAPAKSMVVEESFFPATSIKKVSSMVQ